MTYIRFRQVAPRVAKGGIAPIDPDSPTAQRHAARLRVIVREMLKDAAPAIARHIAHEVDRIGKAAQDPVAAILAGIDFSAFVARIDPIAEILASSATTTAQTALESVMSNSAAVSQVSTRYAVDQARARAAELVGMKVLPDGSIITNPNPVWAITDATRDMLRPLVETAISTGQSAAELTDAVLGSTAFSPARAEMVARTEIITTNNNAAMTAYRESGVVKGKQWSTAGGPTPRGYPVSDDCLACEAQGIIPLDMAFVTGRFNPPNHPHCRCVVIPTL